MKRIEKLLYPTIFSILFALSACTGIYEDGNEMVADSKAVVDEISVDELKQKIKKGDHFYLIDVRRLSEFEKGYINQDQNYSKNLETINIPRGLLEFKINDKKFWDQYVERMPQKDSADIIIYCRSGKRGILASETLLKLGYKKVKNLEGGWNAWSSGPVDSSSKVEDAGCGG